LFYCLSSVCLQRLLQGKVGAMTWYDCIRTPIGWCAVAAGGSGVRRIFLAEPRRDRLLASVREAFPGCRPDARPCREACMFLVRYFEEGAAAAVPRRLDPGPATAFQRAVWDAAVLIPFGQVRTYAWIAERIGRPGAARAVGSALGRNPLPIIVPCHRVVRGDGGLGGFSAPGGTALKRRLLAYEGVVSVELGVRSRDENPFRVQGSIFNV